MIKNQPFGSVVGSDAEEFNMNNFSQPAPEEARDPRKSKTTNKLNDEEKIREPSDLDISLPDSKQESEEKRTSSDGPNSDIDAVDLELPLDALRKKKKRFSMFKKREIPKERRDHRMALEMPRDPHSPLAALWNEDDDFDHSTEVIKPEAAWVTWIRHKISFEVVTLLYFIILIVLLGSILHGIESRNEATRFNWMDGVFTATSALTVTGLSVADTSTLKLGSQLIILGCIQLGGLIGLTMVPLIYRIWRLHRHLAKLHLMSPSFKTEKKLNKHHFKKKALQILLGIVGLYLIGTYVLAFFLLVTYTSSDPEANAAIAGKVSPAWFSIFHVISCLNNAGFSTLSIGAVTYQNDWYVLLIFCWLTMAGNTFYPVFLRILVSFIHWVSWGDTKKHLKFILVKPDKVYTHLFPPTQTRTLAMVLFGLFLVQFIVTMSADWNHALADQPANVKFISGIFQSIQTRTAGFNSIDLSTLNAGTQMVYAIAMVISSYPFVVTFEDLLPTLYKYSSDKLVSTALRDPLTGERIFTNKHEKRRFTFGREAFGAFIWYTKNALSQDTTWVVFITVLIGFIENARLRDDPDFTYFRIIFEVCSAFGTVGLTLGYPNAPYSFAGEFKDSSKFFLIVVMFLGRTRGYLRFITFNTPRKIAKQQEQENPGAPAPVEAHTTGPETKVTFGASPNKAFVSFDAVRRRRSKPYDRTPVTTPRYQGHSHVAHEKEDKLLDEITPSEQNLRWPAPTSLDVIELNDLETNHETFYGHETKPDQPRPDEDQPAFSLSHPFGTQHEHLFNREDSQDHLNSSQPLTQGSAEPSTTNSLLLPFDEKD